MPKDQAQKQAEAAAEEEWRDASDADEEDEEDEMDDESDDEDHTLANPQVIDAWKTAGRLCSGILKEVLELVVEGASVFDICVAGDAKIKAAAADAFKKDAAQAVSKYRRALNAIGFPTCVNVNDVVCHFSPDTDNGQKLVAGDVVRIDLGIAILGHLATAAHTVVVGGEAALAEPLKAKAQAVFAAAELCQKVATRLMRPGNSNEMVTEAIQNICSAYQVNAVQGVLSHRIEWDDVEGTAAIMLQPQTSDAQKVGPCEFAVGEAWMLDIVLTSGSGKIRESEKKPSVFRRTLNTADMRVRASRDLLLAVTKESGLFPFSVRNLDVKTARFGLMECTRNQLVLPYPVMQERAGEVVVHVKSTVLILPKEIVPVAAGPGLAFETAAAPEFSKLVNDAAKRNLSLVAKKKKN